MSRWVHAFVVLAVSLSSIRAVARDDFSSLGLPYTEDETQCFEFLPELGRFMAVAKGGEDRDHFYVRWHVTSQRPVWVSGKDRRPVVSGSKTQGWRLGYKNEHKLNWFEMEQPDWMLWKGTSNRKPPYVYRLDEATGQVVVSEVPAPNWPNFGGNLDPLPSDDPKCTLTLKPAGDLRVHQKGTFELVVQGRVSEASIEEQRVHLNLNEAYFGASAGTSFTAVTPGFFTATAKVKGPTGESRCQLSYAVLPVNMAK